MAQKKIITLEKLGTFKDEFVKVVNTGDEKALADAKAYSDSLAENYDPAGTAATAETNAKNYTNAEIAKVNEEVANVKAQADKGVADAKVADDKAVAAQGDTDKLKQYVGEFTHDTAKTVVEYINAKTDGIATSGNLEALGARVTAVENEVTTIKDDYLTSTDKTEIEGKVAEAKNAATSAQTHSESVAADLASAKAELENVDTAQGNRIAALEEKIDGVTGAMHFKDAVESLPVDVSAYEKGDVILVGEKEYVFNGTEFKEFGDVSAEGKRIGTLETKMDEVQADVTKAKADIVDNATAIAKKAEQTHVDEKVSALEGADTALDTRLKAVEGKLGEGEGSVTSQIDAAKNTAIETAANDATTKAEKTLADAKTYTDGEVAKDRARLDALEADTHTHTNKDLLDTYDQTNADIKDAVTKKHVHENADVLDEIDAVKVAAWDKVTVKADTTALTEEVNRAKAKEAELEASIANFVEASEIDIKNLFV